jgi:hypothetical protein
MMELIVVGNKTTKRRRGFSVKHAGKYSEQIEK